MISKQILKDEDNERMSSHTKKSFRPYLSLDALLVGYSIELFSTELQWIELEGYGEKCLNWIEYRIWDAC